MCKKQKIFLIGIGMGSRESMTVEAAEAIRACDCMIGAQRMLDSARNVRYGTDRQEAHVPEVWNRREGRNVGTAGALRAGVMRI